MDIIATALAETSMELRREIAELSDVLSDVKQRVATIEGQVSVLVAMISNDNGRGAKTIEAEESKIVRKMRVS